MGRGIQEHQETQVTLGRTGLAVEVEGEVLDLPSIILHQAVDGAVVFTLILDRHGLFHVEAIQAQLTLNQPM